MQQVQVAQQLYRTTKSASKKGITMSLQQLHTAKDGHTSMAGGNVPPYAILDPLNHVHVHAYCAFEF